MARAFWISVAALTVSACGANGDGTEASRDAGSVQTSSTVSSASTDAAGITAPDAPAGDRAAVVAAAIEARLSRDNSLGGTPVNGPVMVVDRLGYADISGHVAVGSSAQALTDSERLAIERALEPTAIQWISSIESVIGRTVPSAAPPNVGVIVSVAEPQIQGDDAVVVARSGVVRSVALEAATRSIASPAMTGW